jgi:hypothetical protein
VRVTFGTAVIFTPALSTSVGRGVGTGVRGVGLGVRRVGAGVTAGFATAAVVFVGTAVRVGEGDGDRVGLGLGDGVGVGVCVGVSSGGRGAEPPDSSLTTGGRSGACELKGCART